MNGKQKNAKEELDEALISADDTGMLANERNITEEELHQSHKAGRSTRQR